MGLSLKGLLTGPKQNYQDPEVGEVWIPARPEPGPFIWRLRDAWSVLRCRGGVLADRRRLGRGETPWLVGSLKWDGHICRGVGLSPSSGMVSGCTHSFGAALFLWCLRQYSTWKKRRNAVADTWTRTPRKPPESPRWYIEEWHGATGITQRERNPARRAKRAAWRRNGKRGRRRG
jgi:hypothetical protein